MEFIKISFVCECCEYFTDIYFDSENGINEVFEKTECRVCKQLKLIGVGDLGYRTDIANPDYYPWQAQFIRIDLNDAICETCTFINDIVVDYRHLVTDCSFCMKEKSMKPKTITKSINEGLSSLIKEIS
jgi:hypothetical protein